ncbi:hypothetical protein N7468_002046 [Penicillium chermesinum]|uniref:Uncharacterized protein n=1 Tax=Penicillium chermesinum TaxID=63820 RepID=A0A9W9PJX5_9EURO|nr:uncharacterized protein N7468_002046 [Penicillium chermesinum]KAJ5247063.1 hypothetical protein N7468_002046 [Penicillium chermesinum]KAJ6145311.1 hypothetical protein N7470_009206 [Penicillium chermesinum]
MAGLKRSLEEELAWKPAAQEPKRTRLQMHIPEKMHPVRSSNMTHMPFYGARPITPVESPLEIEPTDLGNLGGCMTPQPNLLGRFMGHSVYSSPHTPSSTACENGSNAMVDGEYNTGNSNASQMAFPSPTSDFEMMESFPGEAGMHSSPTDVSMAPEYSHVLSHDTGVPLQPASEDTPISPTLTLPAQRKTPRVAMGFRRNCEKCQAHVPGHYLHIIRD